MKVILENLSEDAQKNLMEKLPIFTTFIRDELYKKHSNFFDSYFQVKND